MAIDAKNDFTSQRILGNALKVNDDCQREILVNIGLASAQCGLYSEAEKNFVDALRMCIAVSKDRLEISKKLYSAMVFKGYGVI